MFYKKILFGVMASLVFISCEGEIYQPIVSIDAFDGEVDSSHHEPTVITANEFSLKIPPMLPEEETTETLDLTEVLWLHSNISDWPETANLSTVVVTGGQICLEYDKKNSWPVHVLEGSVEVVSNPWIFIEENGHN